MDIFKKIEKIRKQPEHIRLRWAWGLTAVGMIVVIIIWAISLSAQIGESGSKEISNNENGVSSAIEELNKEKKSIQDATSQMKNVLGNQAQNNSEQNPSNQ